VRKTVGNGGDLRVADRHNPHLSSDQILLFLDGELLPRESAQAKAHFEACWSCRVRREQVEGVIADVVSYRDCLTRSSIPLSTDVRTTFLMNLRQLVRSVGKPTLTRRILDLFHVLESFVQGELVPRHAWISGVVLATFALFLLTRLWEVPRVSASQFLTNAQAAEVRARDGIAKPVVYQKLNIRLGNQAVARTIYRDLARDTQVDYLDGGASEDGSTRTSTRRTNVPNSTHQMDVEFEQTFRTAHLNWEDPLSPSSYDAWRNSLTRKQDEVTQVVDGRLTLTTTTAEGPIKEATITVRASDFHPVSEVFYLNDTRQVEVTELAWQVLPMEAIDSVIFASARVPAPVAMRPAPPAASGPTDAELAETELQARGALDCLCWQSGRHHP
jgi:hypothetical protein